MSAKPIVNRLEEQYADRVRVVRVDLMAPAGRDLALRYQFTFTPFFAGLDPRGNVVWRQSGRAPTAAMLEQLLPP